MNLLLPQANPDFIKFSTSVANSVWDMRIESESLYDSTTHTEPFIEKALERDKPIIVKNIRDNIYEALCSDDREFRNAKGNLEYEYWMGDYAFSMDSHLTEVYLIEYE